MSYLSLFFFGLEFPRGMGDQVEISWKFQGGGGSNTKPSGTKNSVGWGVKLEKNPPWGAWIFSGTIQCSELLITKERTGNLQLHG